MNVHETTGDPDGSRRCVEAHIPASMDQTNHLAENPLCSVSNLDARLGSPSLSVPIPCLYAPQGPPGCDAWS